MDVGEVRVAEDKDFEKLKRLIYDHDGWRAEYSKGTVKVWTKSTRNTDFHMIKVQAVYKDVEAKVLYDVLHDPDYRKVWDTYMLESYDIGCLNPNNDIGYYAAQCPSPMKNRDFVLQRSWLDTGREYLILNHSVFHESVPPTKGYVRAISYLTGWIARPLETGCEMGYVTQCDPKGSLPPWLVNKMTQIFTPKMAKRIQKACLGYVSWKERHNPKLKPWLYPEQMTLSRIQLTQCLKEDLRKSRESLESYPLESSGFAEKVFRDDDNE